MTSKRPVLSSIRMAWGGWGKEATSIARMLGAQKGSSGRLQRQPHTLGSKKLEYIVESCPGRSRICQETRSQRTSLDPFLHLTSNTSYRIFPRRQQHFLGLKPKACTCCWQYLFRNPEVPKCSLKSSLFLEAEAFPVNTPVKQKLPIYSPAFLI